MAGRLAKIKDSAEELLRNPKAKISRKSMKQILKSLLPVPFLVKLYSSVSVNSSFTCSELR